MNDNVKYDVNKVIEDLKQTLHIEKWIKDSKTNMKNDKTSTEDYWRFEPAKCSGYGRKKCESKDAHWYVCFGTDYAYDKNDELQVSQTCWWVYCDECYDLHCGVDPIIRKILESGGKDAREEFR